MSSRFVWRSVYYYYDYFLMASGNAQRCRLFSLISSFSFVLIVSFFFLFRHFPFRQPWRLPSFFLFVSLFLLSAHFGRYRVLVLLPSFAIDILNSRRCLRSYLSKYRGTLPSFYLVFFLFPPGLRLGVTEFFYLVFLCLSGYLVFT